MACGVYLQESFSAEVYSLIIQECTPPALATLARVRKAFQEQSERRLYSRISVHAESTRIVVLDILAQNTAKAQYVEFLSVEWNPSFPARSYNEVARKALEKALWNLRNLKDLRIFDCEKLELLEGIESAIW